MPPSSTPCPKCNTLLAVPVPPPERIACPKCKTVTYLSGRGDHPVPRAGRNWGFGLVVAIGGLLLLGGIGGIGWLVLEENKDSANGKDKEQAKAANGKEPESGKAANGDVKEQAKVTTDDDGEPTKTGPQLILDEDFRSALEKEQTRPAGWVGDAFRVTKDQATGDPCFENGSSTGYQWVALPIPNGQRTLRGDFSINIVYFLHYYAEPGLTVRLDGRKSTAVLPVAVSRIGGVSFGDDRRDAPAGFKPGLPTRLVLTREGKTLRVKLNKDVVGEKTMDAVTDIDKIQIGLPSGSIPRNKLYKVTINTLP